jgi:outer membrane lipoprotein-sorting protein
MMTAYSRCLAALWLLAAALFIQPSEARAQGEAGEITPTPQQWALVKRVERYLNNLTTLQSKFYQQSSTDEFAEGEIYLSRPGKIRIEYKPPAQVLIIAKGEYLSYVDKELKNVTYIPVADTPAAFLLNKHFSFDPKKLAFYEISEEKGAVYLTVAKRDEPFAGRLTLIFRADPLSLRKWSVVDAQGTAVDIILADPFYGGQIDPKMFEFVEFEPGRGGD